MFGAYEKLLTSIHDVASTIYMFIIYSVLTSVLLFFNFLCCSLSVFELRIKDVAVL